VVTVTGAGFWRWRFRGGASADAYAVDYIGDIRVIDDLIKRLRKKLAEAESALEIKTVWGYGYRVDE
jgi:DNA-binding response OmpR family regulator